MENTWLSQFKRLHAIAECGLAFCDDPFDKERYEEIASIACNMMSQLASQPVSTIKNLLTPDIKRYVTPQLEVRAAIIVKNEILLVQEKSDMLWTMPGGYADVGLSATQNTEKEVLEEAGIKVKAERLFALRHKARGNYDADIREFYKMFFLCSIDDVKENIKPSIETADVNFFPIDSLPPLSTGRVILRDIENAFAMHHGQMTLPQLD